MTVKSMKNEKIAEKINQTIEELWLLLEEKKKLYEFSIK